MLNGGKKERGGEDRSQRLVCRIGPRTLHSQSTRSLAGILVGGGAYGAAALLLGARGLVVESESSSPPPPGM
jgi:hypothetical protein